MFYVEGLKKGDVLSGVIRGVDFETEYYVSAVACDLAGNMSSLSPRVTVTTGPNSAPVLNTTSPLDIRIKAHETTSADFEIVEPDGHFYLIDLATESESAYLDTLVRNKPKIKLKPSLAPAGVYEAVMTVTDVYGMSSEAKYRYEILENHKPTVKKSFENVIFDSKAAVMKELVASEYFDDEDGEELSYSFEFSHPDVANMTYSAGKFQLTSMNYGVSDICVTGTDVRGEKISQSLKVLVRSASEPVTLYPNPVKDKMNIRVGADVSMMSVKIVSTLGNVFYKGEFTDASPFETLAVDMTDANPGVYTVVVVMDGFEHVKQVVKL